MRTGVSGFQRLQQGDVRAVLTLTQDSVSLLQQAVLVLGRVCDLSHQVDEGGRDEALRLAAVFSLGLRVELQQLGWRRPLHRRAERNETQSCSDKTWTGEVLEGV